MKAFLSIKYHADGHNRGHIENISLALAKCDHETVCVVRDIEAWGQIRFSPKDLLARTFAALDGCEIVMVELTEKGVGVGVEAGYAYAKKIPVVVLAKKGVEISTSLLGIARQVIVYQHYDEIPGLLLKAVSPWPPNTAS